MKNVHALAVALLLGLAAGVGVFAATRTAGVRSATQPRTSSSAIVARSRRLDQVERQLRRALRDRPPALPAVPPAPASAAVPRVVYQRPAPLVVLSHSTSHHEGDDTREAEGGND